MQPRSGVRFSLFPISDIVYPATMCHSLLACRGIAFAYPGGPPLLQGIDLALHAGERVVLTGAPSCGKTTLLLLLLGLLRPAAGEVAIKGAPCRRARDFVALRKRVCLLPARPDDLLLCPTVGEELAFGPRQLGWPGARVTAAAADALDRVGLAGYEDRFTRDLEMATRRKVALAAALAVHPDVLLVDTPPQPLDAAFHDLLAQLPQTMLLACRQAPNGPAARHIRLCRGLLTPEK